MALQDTRSMGKSILRRYWTSRGLAVWLAVTFLVVGYVYQSVLDVISARILLFGFLRVTPLLLGVVLTLVGGVVFAVWSDRPRYAVGGVALVGLAALPVTQQLGCPGVGCSGVEHFQIFLDWTLLGPAVSAGFGAGRCVYICPHTVHLLPLILGYLLIAEAVTNTTF
ncbi:hypothetical protein [Haladaptatus sp. DJG-WS-42]|uniref:hypothetical protein n=1 Tax=Haladaptatus sp. DJG-WS-42 TaxID=3120516 RepID=UPI0030D3A4D7